MSTSQALYGPAKVGGDVLSYCTKCKMELAHVIVAMIDTQPKKVQCKTCRGTHNYKRTTGVMATKTASGRKPRAASTPRTQVRAADLWDQRMASMKAPNVVPYRVSEKFEKDDVLQHPQFGLGIVDVVHTNGKMVVFFREGEKTLVHSMQRPAPAAE